MRDCFVLTLDTIHEENKSPNVKKPATNFLLFVMNHFQFYISFFIIIFVPFKLHFHSFPLNPFTTHSVITDLPTCVIERIVIVIHQVADDGKRWVKEKSNNSGNNSEYPVLIIMDWNLS